MAKAQIITAKDVELFVEQLPTKQRIRLVERLEKLTFGARLTQLAKSIQSRPGFKPMSDEEINAEVKAVRRARNVQSSL